MIQLTLFFFPPKDGDRHGRSFGAFAASVDEAFGRYFSQCLAHGAGEEISQNIATMFMGGLRAYQEVSFKAAGCSLLKLY